MDLHVTARHLTVSDDFAAHMDERLARLDHFVPPQTRIDAVVTKGSAGDGVVVELTLHGRTSVIRAEAGHDDKYAAFDAAVTRLTDRVKKAAERRRSGRRRVVTGTPADLPGLATPLPTALVETSTPAPGAVADGLAAPGAGAGGDASDDGPDVVDLPDTPIEVRVKRHQADPMNLEQAVYEMEMVGHDFFLFTDADTGLPSVLYKRRGWSYGVLHLEPRTGAPQSTDEPAGGPAGEPANA